MVLQRSVLLEEGVEEGGDKGEDDGGKKGETG